ncbi:MAG: hypothetical protein A2V63_08440 [Candidatus Eisenbacteria bacterium RBG_19FT_COMBO_70_11]|nr:MAG: hypothetical protein A2V63_08440 [Candidatus Eisenbacteria bacterium RBG_19FT_COMBO_70_11]
MISERGQIERRRRRLRAELRALSEQPLMRGSVVERRRRCGRANCACARDPGARHRGTFLTVHLQGATRAAHVRPEDEAAVRAAVAAYRRLWTVIDALTALELADLKRQARERRRARRRRG